MRVLLDKPLFQLGNLIVLLDKPLFQLGNLIVLLGEPFQNDIGPSFHKSDGVISEGAHHCVGIGFVICTDALNILG